MLDATDWLWILIPIGVQVLGWYFWTKVAKASLLPKSRTVLSVVGAVSIWLSDMALILFIFLRDRDTFFDMDYFYKVGVPLLGIGFFSAVASVIGSSFGRGLSRVCFLVTSAGVLVFWLGVANGV